MRSGVFATVLCSQTVEMHRGASGPRFTAEPALLLVCMLRQHLRQHPSLDKLGLASPSPLKTPSRQNRSLSRLPSFRIALQRRNELKIQLRLGRVVGGRSGSILGGTLPAVCAARRQQAPVGETSSPVQSHMTESPWNLP